MASETSASMGVARNFIIENIDTPMTGEDGMSNIWTAKYRIVTPMFCGGADNKNAAELRLASFKGALRFWWRTLMWRETDDVEELRRRENTLFGSANQDFGQSKVRLRLVEANTEPVISPPRVFEGGRLQGAHYLGYGVMEAFASRNKGTEAGQLTRPMIPGGEFTVALKFSSSASDAEKRQVRNALVLLGTVGSMGSKSRKGYGSLTLTHLDNGNELELPVDPAQRLKRVLKGLSRNDNAPLPEWTAWSGRSRIVTLSLENARSVEILDKLGREMVHYRSWGKDGTVLGKPREGNFKEDHDLYYKKPVSIQHPKRIAFGLPHNYGKKPDETVEPAPTDLDRRASPLFLHVHQLSENSHPIGVVTFLPARFLPNDTQIKAFGTDVPLDTSDSFWDPIREFLKRLQGTGTTTQRTTLVGKEVSLG